MRLFRRLAVASATAGLLAGVIGAAAPGALAGSTPVPSSQQTHPRITPRVGRRHSTFHLMFTLATAPSRSAFETTAYQAVVSAPPRSRPSCSLPAPPLIVSGDQGAVARVRLRPTAHGWCRGRYAVTVLLEQTVTCGPLATPVCCGPPVAAAERPRIPLCPVTAGAVRSSSTLDTGTTHFRVR